MVDGGPWWPYIENEELIGVISMDFNHDVVLRVSGDFKDGEEKREYIAWLGLVLNKAAGIH